MANVDRDQFVEEKERIARRQQHAKDTANRVNAEGGALQLDGTRRPISAGEVELWARVTHGEDA